MSHIETFLSLKKEILHGNCKKMLTLKYCFVGSSGDQLLLAIAAKTTNPYKF